MLARAQQCFAVQNMSSAPPGTYLDGKNLTHCRLVETKKEFDAVRRRVETVIDGIARSLEIWFKKPDRNRLTSKVNRLLTTDRQIDKICTRS
jgi:hypothetical protein